MTSCNSITVLDDVTEMGLYWMVQNVSFVPALSILALRHSTKVILGLGLPVTSFSLGIALPLVGACDPEKCLCLKRHRDCTEIIILFQLAEPPCVKRFILLRYSSENRFERCIGRLKGKLKMIKKGCQSGYWYLLMWTLGQASPRLNRRIWFR